MTPFYTYLHCKPNGDPFYVGKGTRYRCNDFSHRNQHHKRIVAKYGRSNIGIFIFPCESESQAHADEIQQIAQLRLDGYELANICNGGEGASGAVRSTETRAKVAAANQDQKRPAWACKRMSESHIGQIPWNKGKKTSLEQCAKLVAAKQNITPETRAKMSASKKGKAPWNKGIPCTQERKDNQSAKMLGRKTGPFSEAHKQAISDGKKRATQKKPTDRSK